MNTSLAGRCALLSVLAAASGCGNSVVGGSGGTSSSTGTASTSAPGTGDATGSTSSTNGGSGGATGSTSDTVSGTGGATGSTSDTVSGTGGATGSTSGTVSGTGGATGSTSDTSSGGATGSTSDTGSGSGGATGSTSTSTTSTTTSSTSSTTTTSSTSSTTTNSSVAPACDDGVENGTETDVDCGGTACAPCGAGLRCVSASDCYNQRCVSGTCSFYPAPPTQGAIGSGSSCAAGVDPTKSGGDMLWAAADYSSPCTLGMMHSYNAIHKIAFGPAGDLALGLECDIPNPNSFGAVFQRWSSSGQRLCEQSWWPQGNGADISYAWLGLSISPANHTFASLTGTNDCGNPFGPLWCYTSVNEERDASCALVSPVTSDPDPAGTLTVVTSTIARDLGCGLLPAASGGSTLLMHRDAGGACVFNVSIPVPDLSGALAPDGTVALGGLTAAASVDLGGGALAPIGAQDVLVGLLDAVGQHVWSRRLGAPGLTINTQAVTVSRSGDVYLRTAYAGAVDLGGGPISALGNDTVVASYAQSGAVRWSRDFPIRGRYSANVDPCGSLVLVSGDFNYFDAGFGPIPGMYPSGPVYVALVRYAP